MKCEEERMNKQSDYVGHNVRSVVENIEVLQQHPQRMQALETETQYNAAEIEACELRLSERLINAFIVGFPDMLDFKRCAFDQEEENDQRARDLY
jgi:hypothetical protein